MAYRLLEETESKDVSSDAQGRYRLLSDEEEKQFKPKRSLVKKGARIGAQFGLGMAEQALLPYEIATAPLASKEAQHGEYRKGLFEDIERLQEQKQTGVWDQQDEALLKNLVEQIKEPSKAEKFVKTADIGVRGLAEKGTGLDLRPEGVLEKAAHWTGFIKNPKNAKELIKLGTSPKEVMKAIIPGKDALRGLGAGAALQMAEDEKFGPMGTMAAAVVGDLMGAGAKGLGKAILSPKETLAKGSAMLATRKSAIAADLKEAAIGKEFVKDIGTLTDNNMVKMIQARLAASGLTGKPLENLRKQMTREIVEDYETIAKELGESRFETLFEAGEIGKDALKKSRDADREIYRNLYKESRQLSKDKYAVFQTKQLAERIESLEKEMRPGAVKSPESQKVLSEIENLKSDIYDAQGNLKPASVESLINNKINLNEIIDYEVQGGAKQKLKGIVSDIDETLKEYGKTQDVKFLKKYSEANARFAKHAADFRNKNIDRILRAENPEILMSRLNNVGGIRDLKKALSYTPEGKQVFNNLARKKLDLIFDGAFKDGMKDQIQFGRFASTLNKGKNRELIKEILSPEAYKRLLRLEKHVGELHNTAQKFFNASQSATAGADMTMIATAVLGTAAAITGNPWAISGLLAIVGGRGLSSLIANPEFLKMAEEAIKIAKTNNVGIMEDFAKRMTPIVKQSVYASGLQQRS